MSDVADYDPASRVYHLRRAGFSFPDIAQELEMSTGEAIYHYRQFQKDLAAAYGVEERDAVVRLELDRLDQLQVAPYQRAIAAGEKEDIETVLKIMTHRMKLLGLDQVAPTDASKVANILVVGGSQQDFIDALNAGRQHLTGRTGDDEEDLEERG